MKSFDYENVKNPLYFKEGCEPSHSDHRFYRNFEELEDGKSSFRYDLNGLWKFHYAKNIEETIKGFELPEYSCRNWDSIRVPAHIQMEGYGHPQYVNTQYPWEGVDEILPGEIPKRFNPVASYVKYFQIPSSMKEKKIFLVLEGAESAAAVWLNGHYVGYHEDSFTPAEFELTKYLNAGENKLAVQVYRWCSGSWCEDQDFFRFSGLFRDVYLYSTPATHVKDVKVLAMPYESLEEGEFELDLKAEGKGRIKVSLKDGKNVVATWEEDIKENMHFQTILKNPKLWSSEVPYLYTYTIEVLDEEGNLQECVEEKAGFRRFEIKDSILCLNGKRIVFKGVNRHEFSSVTGRVVSEKELIQDLRVMKQNNINAIRTSHYPNSSMLYRLCDEYGLYLIDEVNLETHGTWGPTPLEKTGSHIVPKDLKEWKPLLMERASSMYERDKNHPSILIWSCGNESYGGSVIHDMSEYFRKTDPTRKVHYEGIFFDRRYPDTSDMESQMYTPVEEIKAFLKEHRDKPFICCEYAHAMGNSCGALYKYTELTGEDPLYQGGFIWDYIDQTLDKKTRYGEEFQAYGGDFQEHPTDYNFSGNGIVYGDTRMPSPKMQEVKYLYQNLNVKVTKDKVEIDNQNLFLNSDHYACKVKLQKDGIEKESKEIKTSVPPLSKGTYPLPIEEKTSPGEYAITVSFYLKDDEIWAKRGHEVAFGQYVYKVEGCKEKEKRPLSIVKSRHNIGVYTEDFSVMFSLLTGGLVSYQYGGKELLEDIPRPNFWRAPTDNDCGCLMQSHHAQWKIASLYASARTQGEDDRYPNIHPYEVEERENSVKVTFQYSMPTNPKTECRLSYEVFGDGRVRTELTYEPVKGMPDMPEFGVLFKMNADYDRVTWYGLGPEETYADRKCGAKLGIYENTVMENMAKYIVPQECGNKEEVRYAKVTDKKGRGLIFRAEEGTMNFSALPFTPHQMEEATHFYELPKVHHTIVRVALGQMGVGGDNSWGAKTHEEFRLLCDKPLKFVFSFQGI